MRELGRRHIIGAGDRRRVASRAAKAPRLVARLRRMGCLLRMTADAACGVFIEYAGRRACTTLGADSVRADGSLVGQGRLISA